MSFAGGPLLRVEVYTLEHPATFQLNNAVDSPDYRRARDEVKWMEPDPDRIKHHKPAPANRHKQLSGEGWAERRCLRALF